MNSFSTKYFPARYLWMAACLLLWIYSLVTAFEKSKQTGASDLRVRMVGARVAHAGLNPYLFKWNESYPETFCDPNDNLLRKVNGLTVTPFVL